MKAEHTLAAIGAVGGAWKYYVKPELERFSPATYAWAAIGAGVLAYEMVCPEGETLSEGVDRALSKHKLITTLAVGATALHLLNKLPEKLDPFVISNNRIKR